MNANQAQAIRTRQLALIGLILAAAALAIVSWTQRPEGAVVWLTGMLSLPLAWLVVVLTGAMPGPEKPTVRTSLYNSLLGAAALITASLAVVAAVTLEIVPENWSTRFGMLSGALVLIVIGNVLPKKIEPGCSPDRGLRTRRLLGWAFVVTGLVAVPIWLFAPIEYARSIGLSVYGLAAALTLIALVRIKRRSDAD